MFFEVFSYELDISRSSMVGIIKTKFLALHQLPMLVECRMQKENKFLWAKLIVALKLINYCAVSTPNCLHFNCSSMIMGRNHTSEREANLWERLRSGMLMTLLLWENWKK